MEKEKNVQWVWITAVLIVLLCGFGASERVQGANPPFIEEAEADDGDTLTPSYRPGATNPVRNPARFYLRRDDMLCTLLDKPGNHTFTRNWNKATGADLTTWANDTSTVLNEPNFGNGSLNKGAFSPTAIAMGRINGPEKDDVVGAFYYIDGKKVKPYVFFVDHPEINTMATDAFSEIQFDDVTSFSDYWSIDIVAGDLDRKLNANGEYNDEIVLIFSCFAEDFLGHWVYIAVLDKDLNMICSNTVEKTLDHPRDYNLHTHAFVSVTVGDYNNDGVCEIATGYRYENAYSWDEKYWISTWKLYDGGWLRSMDDFTYTISDDEAQGMYSFNVVDMTSGDFNGDGIDDFAVAVSGFVPLDSQGWMIGCVPYLLIFTADQNLKIQLKGGWGRDPQNYNGGTRGSSITSGLFKYDPTADFTTVRRQIAMASVVHYNDFNMDVRTFEVDKDYNAVLKDDTYYLSNTSFRWANDTTCIPKITAGNFKGIDSETITEQIAVSWADKKQPKFVVYDVDENLKVSVKYQGDFKPGYPDETDWEWSSVPIVAADRDGKGYYLGAPIHLVIPSFMRANYVIQEPPKHLDYLFDENGDWQLVRVSRYREFYASFEYGTSDTLTTIHKSETNFDVGGSEQVSAKETLTGGDPDIASANITLKEKEKLAYDYDSMKTEINGKYKEVTTEAMYNADRDDYLQIVFKWIDIWRYPIYGYKTPDNLNGFYEVVMPSSTTQTSNTWGLMTSDYYQPLHENGNLLSYPRISKDFPEDLGSFVVCDPDGSNCNDLTQVMSKNTTFGWGDGSAKYSVEWGESSWSTDIKEHTHKLNFNTDFQVGFSATANEVAEKQKWYANIDLSFHVNKSWSKTDITKNTIDTTELVTIYLPSSGNLDQAYDFKPVVYSTKDGTLKLAHAVDFEGEDTAMWWQRNYKGQPDPALNLPRKFHWKASTTDTKYVGKWYVAADRQSRSRMRRLFLLHNEPKTADTDRLYVAASPTAGDILYVLTTVYNYSQDTATGDFKVRFSYADYNPDLYDQAPNLTTIGEVKVDSVDPLLHRDVYVKWDTTGLGGVQPGTAKSYVIYVTVDPDNEVPHEIHELYVSDQYCLDVKSGEFNKCDPEPCLTVNGKSAPCGISCASNNQGYWPWDNSFSIFSAETDEEPQEKAAVDISIESESLVVGFTSESESCGPDLFTHMPYRLKCSINASEADKPFRDVFFYDNGRVFSVKRSFGLNPGANDFYCEWIPTEPGEHTLEVMVSEDEDDTAAGNNWASLDVEVLDYRLPAHR